MVSAIHHIDTLDLPALEPYRTLRRPLEHLARGIFVAEGDKVVTRLLHGPLTLRSLLLTEEWFTAIAPLVQSHPSAIEVFIGEKKLLETIVGHGLHQSIMAIADVPARRRSSEIADGSLPARTIAMVDGITNAENMGVIVRNCACFHVDALLVLPSSCDPYLRRSVRNSMGNILRLPIVYIENAETEIKELKAAGFRFYGAHPQPGSEDIRVTQFPERTCIVLGAEGNGISSSILELCDATVTIPMQEGVDSLNVGSAGAVMLWEVWRKRNPEAP